MESNKLNDRRSGQRLGVGQRLGYIIRPQPSAPADEIALQERERCAQAAKR
jgi:hypothetical protein